MILLWVSVEGELSLFKAVACQWGGSPENAGGRRVGYGIEKEAFPFSLPDPAHRPLIFRSSPLTGAGKLHPISVKFVVFFLASSRHWVSWDTSLKTVCETIGESFLSLYFVFLTIFRHVEEVFFDGLLVVMQIQQKFVLFLWAIAFLIIWLEGINNKFGAKLRTCYNHLVSNNGNWIL